MNSRQADVFDFSIRPTVDDILNGYNGTVFAYGQTGAGKSYTMMGANIDDEAQKGIIPRMIEQIFASILASAQNIEYTVRVSYMEIYMERIRDLMQPQNDNLPVHEEKSRGVYVKGLMEIYVSSVEEVYEVMRRGGLARAVAATNMNQESSRSHSIFVITVTQKNVETGSAKSGQLFLVDLAGSEKVGKTGATGQTLEEAKKINKSLSALGMVINALTDGKSTHIPYRDSKLTRILQESLGGNSRTTLIINCSPSSYNDQETLSTLRFGMRAKSIQNKAKVNAELSPAELKLMLRKAQSQVVDFESYIGSLETEIQQWRKGESVPKESWTPAITIAGSSTKRATAKSDVPSTPSRGPVAEVRRSETPSRPDSRMDLERAGTPSLLEKDEREEFLRRENELQDQLAEKESQCVTLEETLGGVKEQLAFLKEHDLRASKDNERLTGEVNELRMHVEKMSFEAKEDRISMDGLKEANQELTAELDEVKQQLLEARMSARENGAMLDEKEKLKRERMTTMMAGFELGGELFSDNERSIRRVIEHIDALQDSESMDAASLQELRRKLLETQGIIRQAEASVNQHAEHEDASSLRREELEQRLATLQYQYEAVLKGKLDVSDIEAVKARLIEAYGDRQASETEHVAELSADLERRADETRRLKAEVNELQQRVKAGVVSANGLGHGDVDSKTLSQQIAEFDQMKKSLMRDLQNRCERVVELEISLDETREQYNNVLRTSNNRAQQKKMAFLERNLEQLTMVQKQLMEQNSSLKKEVAIAERKLIARNERIQSLESLLTESQDKLVQANHRYAHVDFFVYSICCSNHHYRFEVQLTAVKERLEAAKAGSTRGLGGIPGGNAPASFAFGVGGSRIAKPLRGGAAVESAPNAQVAAIQGQENGAGKRSSWFFNQR